MFRYLTANRKSCINLYIFWHLAANAANKNKNKNTNTNTNTNKNKNKKKKKNTNTNKKTRRTVLFILISFQNI